MPTLFAGADKVRSFADFAITIAQAAEPQPKWSKPLAVVLFLLCIEALIGSVSKFRRGERAAIADHPASRAALSS